MPHRPARPCRHVGCGTLVDVGGSGFCPDHQPRRRRVKDIRPSSSVRGYGTQHGTWRRRVLARDPKCRLRLRGCTGDATVAHHILPKDDHPELAYVDSNGLGACHHCHEVHHGRKRAV